MSASQVRLLNVIRSVVVSAKPTTETNNKLINKKTLNNDINLNNISTFFYFPEEFNSKFLKPILIIMKAIMTV